MRAQREGGRRRRRRRKCWVDIVKPPFMEFGQEENALPSDRKLRTRRFLFSRKALLYGYEG